MGRVLRSETVAIAINDHVYIFANKEKLLTEIIIWRCMINILADDSTQAGKKLTLIVFPKAISNSEEGLVSSPVALQLRPPPRVSARAPAHRSYHFRGVKLKSCIKKIHHNLYISKQANVRIKHADTEGASHKKFGTDARVQ